jgi:hypothetical protein
MSHIKTLFLVRSGIKNEIKHYGELGLSTDNLAKILAVLETIIALMQVEKRINENKRSLGDDLYNQFFKDAS